MILLHLLLKLLPSTLVLTYLGKRNAIIIKSNELCIYCVSRKAGHILEMLFLTWLFSRMHFQINW